VLTWTISQTTRRVAALLSVAGCLLLAGDTIVPSLGAQQLAFDQVVGQLKAPDAKTRLSALRLLAESGYPEAAAPVAPLLSDPDARVRREALYAELAFFVPAVAGKRRVGDPLRAFEANWGAMPIERVPMDVISGLLTPLRDESGTVRAEAAYALAVLGQVDGRAPGAAYKAVVEGLAERLGDPDKNVRVAAARACGRIFRGCGGNCGVVAVERLGDGLVRLLNDTEASVQGAAMEALGELRYERAVKGLTDVMAYYRTGDMAWAALDTLARIGHASSVPTFNSAFVDQDPNFRRSAAEGLARTKADKASDIIQAAAGAERDGSVSLAMAYGQHRLGKANETQRIIQALGDRGLRKQAQEYLVELGPAAAADVAAALAAASPDARVALLEVLAVIGGPQQAGAVEALQNDRDAHVAAAAQQAFWRIRKIRASSSGPKAD
jgi:HEAT repeat protein